MNLKKLVFLISLICAVTSAIADLRSDTQKQFDKYCFAVKSKNGVLIEKDLRATFAPEFKFIPKEGKSLNLDKWIADEKMEIKMTQMVKSVTLHIDTMTIGKNTSTANVTLHYIGIVKLDPKGKAGLLEYVAHSQQLMVRKKGRWWITQMKETKSDSSFNGKPLS